MSASCPKRVGDAPHLYGHELSCMYCGERIDADDPEMNCTGSVEKPNRFMDRILLVLLAAIIFSAWMVIS